MNITRIALCAVIVSASLAVAGCTASAGEPTSTPTTTSTPTPTPTADTNVTDLVLWGDRVDSQNAAGETVGSVALGGTDAAPIISFLSTALSSEPVVEDTGADGACRVGIYSRWAGNAPDGEGVEVYDAGPYSDEPSAVVVTFQAPETNNIALRTGFGAQIGSDVSAYLASDQVLVVDPPGSAADAASGKTLANSGFDVFIFDIDSATSLGAPVGVVSYVNEPGILAGSIAPGSWSAGYC